ncbi:N,N-dimethylformamidase beta subunit [Sarocladium implicatum]|nr:N,N-dimethylformamidase beta subunit [Sarocladium implicatum]
MGDGRTMETDVPGGHEQEIIGYTDPWIASPGQLVQVKVSSTVPSYTWSLSRIIQGFDFPRAPAVKYEPILEPTAGPSPIKGVYQRAHSGSYALVDSWRTSPSAEGMRFTSYVQPWLLDAGHEQVLVSTLDVDAKSGFALVLSDEGRLNVASGNGSNVDWLRSNIKLRRWRWAKLSLTIVGQSVQLEVKHCERLAEIAPAADSFSATLSSDLILRNTSKPLTLAAGFFKSVQSSTSLPDSTFNGRIDSPHIELSSEGVFSTWAKYDFAVGIPTDDITDVSGNKNDGILVNAPTRAVKGYDWDGSEPDWTKAKYGYGAIHFHEDDLDDAGWQTDFSFNLPPNIPSGAYAVVVRGTGEHKDVEDHITFFVRPSPSSLPRPKVAMVLSTFTYLAYANEHMYDQTRASRMELSGDVNIRKDSNFRRMARRTDLGCSLYDVHRDGSGCVFSTSKRPILNIRPGYVNWAFHRPREFSADQLMIGLLEDRLGRGNYDILTDHDVHASEDALRGYDVVLTGCHPEYPSLELLNAYAAYSKSGGSLMYLGGNGFYWCSVTDPARPHRIEVRKGDQGCRSVELPAGERMHSLNGGQGGLWRSRGRNPQSLFGVGSCACGNGQGVAYKFEEAIVNSKEHAWLFEGLSQDPSTGQVKRILGPEGFGGGASGDEIDRMDFALGTPSNAILLATSVGHDDTFGLFNEEIMYPMINTTGTVNRKIRSDMVLFETSGGGMVFSVGSINWYGSLGWDAYENNVAKLTWNVVKRFMAVGEKNRK